MARPKKTPAMPTNQNIRAACGMLASKTSVTKELLVERAKDKKCEGAKLKNRQRA